ncbi:trehalose operon transcriptional repressor [Bacillus glycinifermentans]|uniref:Trehalose operon repressor n=1 Tax=Bacillus glycinifermentans TaxID=1664069 RepID=A0A0J6EXP2_9BACI|nr:trehalose operon repressor [Bacillus glycinifermentans]ATH94712.1 trehalose operon repressor [Bacillus glycinifermentans]KMM57235.1 trehalose operon transcriptional repressor [Bacillus glycinifermentans]KRT93549.1 transcriptional regulator [Bacillus glycinifermentans]MEC0485993.1 trehalose operon repressor [Bacillus glycinifermentans]MEC0496685.1 trehalose operon repressor [Bacillus glycinifermentans]
MKVNKYVMIYKEIAEQIDQGILNAGDILPSEHDLTDRHDTSRETVRKALNMLAQNGYIQKIRGKGSVVLNREKMQFPVSGLVSFKELSETLGRQTSTTVHEFGLIHPGVYIQKQLRIKEDEEVWRVVRSRTINGERVILDKDYFIRKNVPLLTKEICEDSIYQYIEDELGLAISYAHKEIVVEPCTETDQTYLDLNGYEHIVVVKNYVFLDDTTLFQYTESRHRLDKFRFVDFARREK